MASYIQVTFTTADKKSLYFFPSLYTETPMYLYFKVKDKVLIMYLHFGFFFHYNKIDSIIIIILVIVPGTPVAGFPVVEKRRI